MPLNQSDAIRILRFCLGADDSGSASQRPDGACLVTIALCRASYEVHAFEEPTFEQALRRAAGAGALKAACVDKQIAFLARRDPGPAEDVVESGAVAAAEVRARADAELFLAVTGAIG